ncbi:MAG TPA: cation:dicarboxylase symporter family transporter [Gemmatimonadaceae bacterium]|nr:cation:dicarboxylase symporter family transporter [Gemmatimonadaceae bacterium]
MTGDTRRVTWMALLALVLGLLTGAALASFRMAGLERLIGFLEPIGTLWVNAVRMTIVPLVVSMLIVAVASSDSLRSMGRLGGAALLFFLGTLVVIGVYAALLAPPLLAGLTIDPQAAADLRATAASGSQQVATTVKGMGGFAQRIVELIPPNPIRAAADGAMLPLIAFTVMFAAALSRIPAEMRETPVRFFRGVSEAMLVIIRWVFVAAPVGVFALAVVVGARLGYTAVAAVGYYVGVFALLMIGVMLMVYVAAITIGRVPLRKFATAVAPAQVIALGSRSSSAALPAMIDAARDVLRLPPQIVSFVLPAAVAVFRVSAPISFVLGALFLGKLYDVSIGTAQVIELIAVSIMLSYSVPPVPSGSLFLMAPVFAELGIPVEGVAILIAIDVIPDLLKTTTIVTAHMASAVVVARVAPERMPGIAAQGEIEVAAT